VHLKPIVDSTPYASDIGTDITSLQKTAVNLNLNVFLVRGFTSQIHSDILCTALTVVPKLTFTVLIYIKNQHGATWQYVY